MARLRRRSRRIPDTWDTANASDFRRLNTPAYPVFNPNVRLDPSQVTDMRGAPARGMSPLESLILHANHTRWRMGQLFGGTLPVRQGLQKMSRMNQTLAEIQGKPRRVAIPVSTVAGARHDTGEKRIKRQSATPPRKPTVTKRTVEGLDGKPKTQFYRGDRLIRPARQTRPGGTRVY